MSPKYLIVMALKDESQGMLEEIGHNILYCGVGKVNAAYHLTRVLSARHKHEDDFSCVLNIGSAGSSRFKTGQLVASDRFVQRDMDVTGLGFPHGHTPFEQDPAVITFPRHFQHLPHGTCGSGDSFLQGPSPVDCDIVDMEAYALAKICMREEIPFACAKYITDGADQSASKDWQVNLTHAAQAFAELLKLQ